MGAPSQKLKFQLAFSIAVALAALLVTWFIFNDSSPFASYFLYHVDPRNVWGLTMFLPFVLSAVLSRNPHSPPLATFIVGLSLQWLLVGYLLSIPVARLWARGQAR